METFVWDPRFETGITSVDQQFALQLSSMWNGRTGAAR